MTDDELTPLTPTAQTWTLAYERYAQETGFLLMDWNDLQEQLADLFEVIMEKGEVARSIWYAVPNDRYQRRMLGELARHSCEPTLLAEITWIIGSADKLGQRRDAAAHSPIDLVIDDIRIVARSARGNPLAKGLAEKDLMAEFGHFRECIVVLRQHAQQLTSYLEHGRAWVFPHRPPWPNR